MSGVTAVATDCLVNSGGSKLLNRGPCVIFCSVSITLSENSVPPPLTCELRFHSADLSVVITRAGTQSATVAEAFTFLVDAGHFPSGVDALTFTSHTSTYAADTLKFDQDVLPARHIGHPRYN